MKLLEYETKRLLREQGISTPKGEVITSATEAERVAVKLNPPFAIKAQVLLAGRGKLGGIRFADSVSAVQRVAKTLFEAKIRDIPVRKILVEEKIHAKKELYVGLAIDRLERKYALITSKEGGEDIETIAAKRSEQIMKTFLDPRVRLSVPLAKKIASDLGYAEDQQVSLANILRKFVRIGLNYDAELVEINPLAETEDGEFVALDARLIIDDNSLFRHKEYEMNPLEKGGGNTPEEVEALRNGLAYVKLEGNIGVIGNGAGLVMATLDMVQHFGGNPANFLDLGGGAPVERIVTAIKLVSANPSVKVLLINILGGITKCDDVARGIVNAKPTRQTHLPIVVRLVGTNENKGKKILKAAGIRVLSSMEKAARIAVRLASD